MKTWLFGECKKVSKTLALYDLDRFNAIKGTFKESYVEKYCDLEKYPLEFCNEMNILYSKKYKHLWKECKKICHAFISRRLRLMKRIQSMLIDSNGELKQCLFLTMTLTDDFVNSTSAKLRRKYISKFLRQFDCPYVGNIDFGDNHKYIDKKTGQERIATAREHYHAIIQKDKIDWSLYTFGHLHIERIRASEKSKRKLSTYVAKLTNHAIKESTQRSSLLYSRKFK